MKLFLINYTTLLASALVLWALGWVFLRIIGFRKSELSYHGVFLNLFVGFVLSVALIAIAFTKGRTIYLFSLFTASTSYLLYRLLIKKESNEIHPEAPQQKPDTPSLIAFVIIILLGLSVYFFIYFRFLHHSGDAIIIKYLDYHMYARVSYYLAKYGVENITVNPIFPPEGALLYHYSDIYLNALIQYLTKQNPVTTLFFVTYPLIFFISWLGFCSAVEVSKLLPKGLIPLLAFIGILVMGVNFYFPDFAYSTAGQFFTQANELSFPLVLGMDKVSVIYLFMIGAFVLFISRAYFAAYLILSLMPFYYITSLPIWGALLLQAILLFVYRKQKDKAISIIVMVIVSYTFLVVFRLVLEDKSDLAVSMTAKGKFLEVISSISVTNLNIIVKTGLQTALLYSPYLVGLILLLPKTRLLIREHEEIWLFLSVPLVSLLAYSLARVIIDSVQLFSNVAIPALNIFSFSVILLSIRYRYFSISSVLIILLAATLICYKQNRTESKLVTTQDYSEVLNEISECKNVGIFYMSTYPNLFYASPYRGLPITAVSPETFLVAVSNDMEMENKVLPQYRNQIRNLIQSGAFYKYVDKKKKEGKFTSLEDAQIDFIKEYNVCFIVTLSGDKLPDHLSALVQKHYTVGDEIYYILKRE